MSDEITTAGGFLNIHFEPSTIETIDKSVLNYVEALNLYTESNTGWRKTPVIWATAERAFQTKNNKDIRDNMGTLVLPIITITRKSISKPLKSSGAFQANIPAHFDEQGGALPVQRLLYQEKTMKFANADAKRLRGQLNYPRCNAKMVYRTVSAPMPVNVNVEYDITLRTEYQQQMNTLTQPFATIPGTINAVSLREGEHRFEGFIQDSFVQNNNISDFSSEERKFVTNISLKVVGYLVGEGGNSERPHFAVRENAVEVKIPRERVSLQEIPEHEYGAYYGLAGVPATFSVEKCPFPLLFSTVAANTKTSLSSGGSVPANVVTRDNISSVLADTWKNETLKDSNSQPLGPYKTSAKIRENTEKIYLNGLLMSSVDYTIAADGVTVSFAHGLIWADEVTITYLLG